MFVDLPLDELRTFRPDVLEPADFDAFWTGEVAAARAHGGAPEFAPAETRIRHAEVFDVTFPGHGGTPVKAWLYVPRPLPSIGTLP